MEFILIVIAFSAGYAFRGLISKEIKAVGSEVKTVLAELKAEVAKLKSDVPKL